MKPRPREEKIIQHLYEVDGFSLKEISRWFIENELPIMESEVNTFVKHAKLVRAKKNQAIATVETVTQWLTGCLTQLLGGLTMFKWVFVSSWILYLLVSVIQLNAIANGLSDRLAAIEKRDLSKYVLTCKLRDSQNRKVCGYIEVK